MIVSPDGEFRVEDTIHLRGGKIGHVGEMISGILKTGQTVTLKVDDKKRCDTEKNHSATHLFAESAENRTGRSCVEAEGVTCDAGTSSI